MVLKIVPLMVMVCDLKYDMVSGLVEAVVDAEAL